MDKSPDAFRTISEVADDLDLPQHVLRFWETRFPQIKPMKRGGGRRYYRPEDIDLLKGIRHLLYDHGYTIKGVQKLLKSNGNKFVTAIATGDMATMEAIMALVLLVALGGASLRWGYDSRESIRSKEQELAAYGVSWQELHNSRAPTGASPNGKVHRGHFGHRVAPSRSHHKRSSNGWR